jgi:hypothetical protein
MSTHPRVYVGKTLLVKGVTFQRWQSSAMLVSRKPLLGYPVGGAEKSE